jgi:hypothetical protein
MTITSTKKYSQFKNILGNRQLSREHINEPRVEIERNNLLEVCPIICNEKMQVIDGQHRLEAAKALGVAVPYVVVPGLGIEHVVRMNTSQKKWMMKDYIRLHIDLGNQDYIDLQEFINEWKTTPSIAIMLLSNSSYNQTGNKVNEFREGRWSIQHMDEATEYMEVMRALMPHMRTSVAYRSTAFAAAIVKTGKILEKNNLSFDNLLEQAGKSQVLLTYSVRVRDYLKELEEMLNYGRKGNLIRLV